MRAPKGTKKSVKTYAAFREEKPARAKVVRITLPKSVWVMGHLEAVEYFTTIDGVATKFRHKFAKGSRPLLCAGNSRNQLLLVGGRFHVTDRGIVDLTPRGREIDD